MGKRKYLDEAVYPLIPDKLPQLYILPGVAHAVHLSLGLAGVAAGDLTEGGAFVDLMDDKGFDGFGVFTHDLDLIELGPHVEDDVVHAVDVDDLSYQSVGHHIQTEAQQHHSHDDPVQCQQDVFELYRLKHLGLEDLGQGIGAAVGVAQAVGDPRAHPVDDAEKHHGDQFLLQNDLHRPVVEHPQH